MVWYYPPGRHVNAKNNKKGFATRLWQLEGAMNKPYWILLALLSMAALSAQASFAQCARGTVTVQGTVENPPQGASADVLVLL